MANVKLNTKITSFTDVQKSLQSIEKHLNELSSSVNASAETEVSDKDGKTGDIKTTRNVDGTYTFEIRTEEGWKTPSFGENLIKFKDKSASYSQNKVQSIEEVVTNDDSTGDSRANLTSFDEKNNKFILARPDFISDWYRIVHSDFTHGDALWGIEHGLEVIPSLVQVQVATNQGSGSHGDIVAASEITYWTDMLSGLDYNHNSGLTSKYTATHAYFFAGDSRLTQDCDWDTTSNERKSDTNEGALRILVWK
jgi:hypothetical protein